MISCTDAIPNFLGLFDTTIAPKLLYYAYFPIIFICLLLGFTVFSKNRKSPESKSLLFLTISFSIWVINIIVQWIAVHTEVVLFFWQITAIIETLVLVSVVLFCYFYFFQKPIGVILKLIIGIFILIVSILLPTTYNMSSFDLINCEAEIGPLLYFIYAGEVVVGLALLLISFWKRKSKENHLLNPIVGVGSFVFLIVFSVTNIFGELTQTYEINLWGPIGMVIFVTLLTFLIVRFKDFDIKLIGAQALVWALVILIGSQFFFIQSNTNKILTGVTLIISAIVGLMIIRSVKKEVSLRESLEIANRNQESLIHFVSHQLKGFFTKSKMIFSGFLEGDFGETSPAVLEMAKIGLQSDNNAVSMIQDILGASNLKAGTTQYNFNNVDLNDLLREVCGFYTNDMEKKGLKFEIQITEQPITIFADRTQITQVFRNLIDNAMKYSSAGVVKVSLNLDSNGLRSLFEVKDTGIGLTEEDKHRLFTEGGKGEDSLKYNVDSTGYGLYIVKKIVETHKGKIWAESEGRGKGSKFCVELPIVQRRG